MKVNINLASGQNFADLTIIDNDLSVQKKKIPVKSLWDVFYSKKCQTYFHPCTFFNSYESKAKQPGLLYGVSKTDSSEGLYFLPAAQRYMNFSGEQMVLPYPSLVFYLKESDGQLETSKCFALKVRSINRLHMKSVLYAFPFGNVHPQNAHICWGTNNTTGLDGFRGLRQAIETFLCSESNMDYVQKGSFKGYKSYRNLLQDLIGQDKFPNSVLVPSPYFHTIGELLQNFFKEESDE